MNVKYEVGAFDAMRFGLDVDDNNYIDIMKKIELDIENDIEEATASPEKILQGRGENVHIGFDVEYEFNEASGAVEFKDDLGENDVLMYGFYLIAADRVLKGVVYPDGRGKKYRCSFKKLFGNILHWAKKEGVISDWPAVTFIYSHFMRADVSSWSDFWQFSDQVKGVAGTVTGQLGNPKSDIDSMKNGWGMGNGDKRRYRPEPIAMADCNRRCFMTFVNFVDTLLLTPGMKGVSALGDWLGFPKVEIPDDCDIAKMSEFIERYPELAYEYNITDAMISVVYGLVIRQFVRNVLGLRKMPTTIGGIAVAKFRSLIDDKDYFNEVFGVRYIQSQEWDGLNGKVRKRLRKVETVSRRYHSQFFIDGYAGGLNNCNYFGPTEEGEFNDFDLASAYVIAMLDIYPLDYAACFETKEPKDFIGHVMGVAHIHFKFPVGTEHPNLVVKTENYGLVSPLEGECYATAPEIQMALILKADIKITHGVIVPWKKDEPRIFEQFVRWVRETRAQYEKSGESLLAEFVKSIGNTLYGKTATLRPTSFFDTEKGDSKTSSPSPIANPYIASHVTGLVRATLSELINNANRGDYRTYSATTDGLLTDAPSLDLSGPFSVRYQELCDLIDGENRIEGSMLKRKHWVKQLVSIKTRGNCTAEIADDRVDKDDQKIVLAKAGVKMPKEHDGKKLITDNDKNEWFLKLFLNRYPGQKVDSSHFIAMREQWLKQSDLVKIKKMILLNQEYDMKRMPINPRMVKVRETEHLAFDTMPWQTDEEMQYARAIFDGWRKPNYPKLAEGQLKYTQEQIDKANSQANCLKTVDDFYRFEDFFLSYITTEGKRGISVQLDCSEGILKRLFLRAFVREQWGLENIATSRTELANWLSTEGYQTSLDDIANAKRKDAKLVYHAVPVTKYSLKLLEFLLDEFPSFQYQNAFDMFTVSSGLDSARALPLLDGQNIRGLSLLQGSISNTQSLPSA